MLNRSPQERIVHPLRLGRRLRKKPVVPPRVFVTVSPNSLSLNESRGSLSELSEVYRFRDSFYRSASLRRSISKPSLIKTFPVTVRLCSKSFSEYLNHEFFSKLSWSALERGHILLQCAGVENLCQIQPDGVWSPLPPEKDFGSGYLKLDDQKVIMQHEFPAAAAFVAAKIQIF